MKLMKNIRFNIILVTVIFVGSALLGNLFTTGQDHKPLLQTILDRADALVHGSQSQKGTGFMPADAYSSSEASQGRDQSSPEIAATIKRGESFDTSLSRQNIPAKVRLSIIDALRSKLNFKRIKPEDNYTLKLDGKGELASFRYESSPLDILTIKNSDNGYQVSKAAIELERKKVKISGEINSSLFAAFTDKDEDMRLVYAFADIFSSRIDFNTEIQPGDRFSLVVDKYYKNGKLVGYGKIEAAQYYRLNGPVLSAYLFSSGTGKDVYYDQDGLGVGTSFLRSPVPIGRLTSKFTYRRRHPITGQIKPHLGVDLAAPVGTPIMAAADGKIVDMIHTNTGFGNQIIIAHSGDYKTYYGHLSRFKEGLHRGSMVSKKDIIGYVGSSGTATGPHLDYRVQHHMVFTDPFATTFKTQVALTGKDLRLFKQETQAITTLADLKSFTPQSQVLKVSNLTITQDHNIMLL
jgi:murein DD-endopeptidase MepM/ murein hydrolase activator NlpD